MPASEPAQGSSKKNAENIYRLSPLQEGMLFHALRDPDEAMYFQQAVFTMNGLDADAFEKAWHTIVQRHPIFRTSFHWENRAEPVQIVHDQATLPVDRLDWRAFPAYEQESQLTEYLTEDRKRGLDLAQAPLIRIALIRIGEDRYYYVWSHHHILMDGWSGPLLQKELFRLYEGIRRGRPVDMPIPRPFRDYIHWLYQQDMSEAENFWRGYLEGFHAPTPIPEDGSAQGQRVRGDRFEQHEARLSKPETTQLNNLVRREKVTLNTLVQGAWALLMSRYNESDDVCFGTLVSGRTPELDGVEQMLGLFINTLPVRIRVEGDRQLGEWLQQINKEQVQARRYEYSPLVKVQGWSQVERGQPLFESLVVFENYPSGKDPSKAARPPAGQGNAQRSSPMQRARAPKERTNYPIGILAGPGEELLLRATYDRRRFTSDAVTRLLDQLKTLLQQIAENPDRVLDDLLTPSKEERKRILESWSGFDEPFDLQRCAHNLIEEQGELRPDAPALDHKGDVISYADFNRRANRLAHYLIEAGVSAEQPVGICLDRGPEAMIGLLAVMKAGGAYLPLDPAYPPERLNYMTEDSGCALVLTDKSLRELLPESVKTVCLDDQAVRSAIESKPDSRPACPAGPDNAVYIIYTSGSTGQPKGVVVEHRNLVNLSLAQIPVYEVGPGNRVLQMISLSFDASIGEIFRTLTSGACLCLAPQEELMPGPGLLKLLREQKISHLATSPSVVASLPEEDLPGLKNLVLGGETCPPEVASRWGRGRRLINGYGPTETTVGATAAANWDLNAKQPMGRPIANVRVYVLDSKQRPVPAGIPGELHIGGAGVSRGYLNRDELTAERFIPDPFAADSKARMYRTGDRVRWLIDGQLEFIGRVDQQVKVRGYRIELGEVEAALADHPKVLNCAADARNREGGAARLIGYVVPASEDAPSADELREFLRDRLPDYMVPSAFVMLEKIPLTTNGKTDRRALPEPRLEGEGDNLVAPSNPTEEIIAGLCAEVLGVEQLSVEDNLQDLGVHSLDATRIVSRLTSALDLDLSLGAIFEYPTVSALAAFVEKQRQEASGIKAPPLVPVGRNQDLPLSFAQQRLWFLEQLEPDNTFYNMPNIVRLPGKLDRAALEAALTEMLRRHESLRTTFASRGENPVQIVHPATPFHLEVVDLQDIPDNQRQAEMQKLRDEEMDTPFDLARGPMFRARAIDLGDRGHALLQCLHHIGSDGWSMDVFNRELAELYKGFRGGNKPILPELPLQYPDFAVWQRKWLSGAVLERHLEYWRERLQGATTVELPLDRPRPPVQRHHGTRVSFMLPPRVAERLKEISREEGTTLFMTTLAVFKILLSRYSRQSDITVGTPIANRGRRELEGLIGFFANTLALRTRLDSDSSFRGILHQVRETCVGAYDHESLPFEKLVEDLQPARDLSRNPIFQIVFSLQANAGGGVRHMGGQGSGGEVTARFDLTLGMTETDKTIDGVFQFNTDLFDTPTIERMADNFSTLAEVLTHRPDVPVGEINFISPRERRMLLRDWNETEWEFADANATLQQLFEAQADRLPEKTAVSCAGESLNYRQLEERSNQLALHLRESKVGRDEPVGLMLNRSVDMIVALLAVLKSGAAYVPLDPAFPGNRLKHMLDDSGLNVLITSEDLLESVEHGDIQTICLDRDADEIAMHATARLENCNRPEDLAYMIYTSGSTGLPKGVMLEHRTVVNFLLSMQEEPGLKESDTLLAVTTLSFDIAVLELMLPLITGATVEIARREDAVDGAQLLSLIRQKDISIMQATPATWRLMIEAGWKPGGKLKVLCGGEALPQDLMVQLRTRSSELWNMYGPTETTIWSTVCCLSGGDTDHSTPSIGLPIANTRVYVLDENLRPAPIGVPGELFIGGNGLARGYLGQPELTAERFIDDPFSRANDAKMYRTGDLARWLPNSYLDCLGRIDQQVKVRGFRIELGEIESAMADHPGIRQAVVAAHPDQDGGNRLVAYIVGEKTGVPELSELRGFLADALPDYMLPSALVALDELPLTDNNKVDRKSLPQPDAENFQTGSYTKPVGETEEVIARVWSEILRHPKVGRFDNFFDLGGHSLLATRVCSRLRAAFKVEVPLRLMFETNSVASLAEQLEILVEQRGEDSSPPLVPVDRDGELPLSFSQQRLWFLDQLAPGSVAYTLPHTARLSGPQDVQALERALTEIVRRHEVLRTTFDSRDGQPFQVINPPFQVELPFVDLSNMNNHDREMARRQEMRDLLRQPWNLARGPVIRAKLISLSAQEHLLLLSMHHIASDGWSMAVLGGEIQALYNAYRAGRPSPLPELPLQYADYSVWQRKWLQGEVLEEHMAHWRDRLQGVEPLDLPLDRPRPRVNRNRGARLNFEVPAQTADGLKALTKGTGFTGFMVLLAATQLLLMRMSNGRDVTVGSPIANRSRGELEKLVGFFVNTLVFRLHFEDDPSFLEVLARVRESALAAYAHQDIPFEKIVEDLAPERDLSRQPLFQVMMTHQATQQSVADSQAMRNTRMGSEMEIAKFDLTVSYTELSDGVVGGLQYNVDLFDESSAQAMVDHLLALLAEVASQPERPVSELTMMSRQERDMILNEWSGFEKPFNLDRTCHSLFEDRVAEQPDAPALDVRGEPVSYAELDRRVNQLANYLIAAGVRLEQPIGLCMQRGPAAIVGILATVKAGGVYLPLHSKYPPERLAYMIEDTGCRVVLTQESLRSKLPEDIQAIRLDDPMVKVEIESQSTEQPPCPAGSENAAYVIYTSGSTGLPKGVVVEHRNLVNLLEAHIPEYRMGPGTRTLHMVSLSFDASVGEIFRTLCSGATLCIASPEDLLPGPGLINVLRDMEISIVAMPPSLLANLPEDNLPALTSLIIGGEACPPEVAVRWGTGRRLINTYGPTETTCGVTLAIDWDLENRQPMGKPIANVKAYVLDQKQQPVPIGVPGELYLGGAQVARGYLNREELTAERFLPDPFANDSEARMYRSGDRVRWWPDGQLEFLGRVDQQVKVRGYRIELGEVESVLVQHPQVKACAVDARSRDGGVNRLIGYLVANGEEVPSAEDIREFLKDHLPDYMVPSGFVALEQLPLTANGKVDREALPDPETPNLMSSREYVEPETEEENILAEIWAQLLGLEKIGRHDNFFELGGDSILSIQVIARANQSGLELAAQDIFEHQTVAELAKASNTGELSSAEQDVITGDIPLTPIQHWFFKQDQEEPEHFNWATLMRIPPNFDKDAMRQSLVATLEHHDSLRLRFKQVNGVWKQRMDEPGDELPFEELDLTGVSNKELSGVIEKHAARLQRTLNLVNGPIIKVVWMNTGNRAGRLMVIVHHVAVDAISWRILLEDLMGGWRSRSSGSPKRLPRKTNSFKDWSEALQSYAASEEIQEQRMYWMEPVRKEVASIPVDIEDGPNDKGSMDFILSEMDEYGTRELTDLVSVSHLAPLNVILIAALGRTLAEWTDKPYSLINIEGHGREDVGARINIARTVGWFTSYYPLLLNLEYVEQTKDLVAEVAKQFEEVPARGIGYLILRHLGEPALQEQLAAFPEAEVGFNFMGHHREPAGGKEGGGEANTQAPAESIGATVSPKGQRPHKLDVTGVVRQGKLQMRWTYSKHLHKKETVEAIADRYLAVIREIIDAANTVN